MPYGTNGYMSDYALQLPTGQQLVPQPDQQHALWHQWLHVRLCFATANWAAARATTRPTACLMAPMATCPTMLCNCQLGSSSCHNQTNSMPYGTNGYMSDYALQLPTGQQLVPQPDQQHALWHQWLHVRLCFATANWAAA